MAIFVIKQKNEPSQKKTVIDINSRAKKHKKWLRVSIFFNIMFVIYFTYLTIRNFNGI